MIEEFISSALIIDDIKSEVDDLVKYLDEKDIWARHYTPGDLEKKVIPFNNRKLIFLDLYLDNSKNSVDNIALIRKYFKKIIGKDFGTYGIVLWTKHANHFAEFCEKIFQKNNPFTLPLFAVSLEKTKYIAKGSYEGILQELENKLVNDISSSFFIEWNKAVKKGSDNTIATVYNLFESNEIKVKNLEFIFSRLAGNYTGINLSNIGSYDLQKDLVKSLMAPLQFEISNSYKNLDNLFSDLKKVNFHGANDIKTQIYSDLNSLLLLDFHSPSQKTVIPGNIYEIIDSSTQVYIKEFFRKEKEFNIDNHDDFKSLNKKRICIEITPPCDYAQNKKQFYSRIIGGILMDYDKKAMDYFKAENFYGYIWPISIPECNKPQMIIFDFYRFQTIKEEHLKDAKAFKIFMKAKDQLFADILQKLSSHTARLGIGVLYPI